MTKYGINPKNRPWETSWRKRWTGARRSVDLVRKEYLWMDPSRTEY